MPRNITVTFSDGTTHVYQNAPDDVTPEQVAERARQEFNMEVTSLDGGRNGSPDGSETQTPEAAPSRDLMQEYFGGQSYDQGGPYVPPENSYEDVSDEDFARMEAEFQAWAAENGVEVPAAPKPNAHGRPQADFFSIPTADQWKEGLGKGLGNIVEGAVDTFGMLADPINQTLIDAANKLRVESGKNPLGRADLGGATREALGLPFDDSLAGEIQRGITSGIGFSGLAKSAGNAAGNLVQKGLYELGSTPVRDAIAGGTAAAAAGLTERAGGGPVAQTIAGLAGGTAGFKSPDLASVVSSDARATRFANKEVKNNPYAAYDAEIAEDVNNLTRLRESGPRGKEFKNTVGTKALNDLAESYHGRFRDMIRSLDLPSAEKLRLNEKLDRRETLLPEDIDALRGTPQGNALADGITKWQRIIYLTDRTPRSGAHPWATRTANAVEWLPANAGIPARAVQKLRAYGHGRADDETTRVLAASKLVKRKDAYSKIAAMTGPSGARESKATLEQMAQEALDAKDAAKAAGIQREKPEDVIIQRMMESGAEGEYKAMQSYERSLGLDRDQSRAVLNSIKDENPELAGEIDRLLAGFNTSNGRLGPVLRPLMRAKMKEMGIEPSKGKSRSSSSSSDDALDLRNPLDEAAAARSVEIQTELDSINPVRATLADGVGVRDSQLGMLPPENAARVSELEAELKAIEEGSWGERRINRRPEWERGREMFQSQANDSIEAMRNDDRISREAYETLGNAPRQLRDNFRTTEEAEAYIIDRILPDLEAQGLPSGEINAIRGYLFEVAQAKRYKTLGEYEAGVGRRPRGRQPQDEE